MDSYVSTHIFLFPFSLKGCGGMENIRRDLSQTGWERDRFEYTNGDYGENFSLQGYFHNFAIGALLDDESKHSIIESYKKTIGNNAKYIIDVVSTKNREAKSYKLNVEKITLNIYDGKVGILAFHLLNYYYTEFADVLVINDFGRRIHPLYFRIGQNGEIDLSEIKKKILPNKIILDIDNGEAVFEEDFGRYLLKTEHPFILPNHITGILPTSLHNTHWLQGDLMYVISWYANEELSSELNLSYASEDIEKAFEEKTDSYTTYDKWYRYVYVYKSRNSCNSKSRFLEQLKSATYDRWASGGSLYGVSRFAFVALTNKDGYNVARRYIKSMYYHMASLCIAQRTILLYFSNEIADITANLKDNKFESNIYDAVKKLNLDFIRFTNNIYFREVTLQLQGIELYNLMQNQLTIKQDLNEIKKEIDQLYQYVNMAGDQKRNDEAQSLNNLAAILLPITVVTGFFGINDFFEITTKEGTWYTLCLGCILALALIIYIRFEKLKKWFYSLNKHLKLRK